MKRSGKSKTTREQDATETVETIDRRKALSRLGLGAAAAYVAPSVLTLCDAFACDGEALLDALRKSTPPHWRHMLQWHTSTCGSAPLTVISTPPHRHFPVSGSAIGSVMGDSFLADRLDPDGIAWNRPDGAVFGLWGGARSERCRSIVIDEQCSHREKSARPCGVGLGRPMDSVAWLAGATSPCCAPRLATGLPSPIRVDRCYVIWV